MAKKKTPSPSADVLTEVPSSNGQSSNAIELETATTILDPGAAGSTAPVQTDAPAASTSSLLDTFASGNYARTEAAVESTATETLNVEWTDGSPLGSAGSSYTQAANSPTSPGPVQSPETTRIAQAEANRIKRNNLATAQMWVEFGDLMVCLGLQWLNDMWSDAAEEKFSLKPARRKRMAEAIAEYYNTLEVQKNPRTAMWLAIVGGFVPQIIIGVKTYFMRKKKLEEVKTLTQQIADIHVLVENEKKQLDELVKASMKAQMELQTTLELNEVTGDGQPVESTAAHPKVVNNDTPTVSTNEVDTSTNRANGKAGKKKNPLTKAFELPVGYTDEGHGVYSWGHVYEMTGRRKKVGEVTQSKVKAMQKKAATKAA